MLFPPSLPNTTLLVVMVKYPLFSEADPSCKARQYLTSLSFSNFWHIPLLTGCDRLWELHLWIAKSRYTIHMWKVFNISLLIFFFLRKNVFKLSSLSPQKNTTSQIWSLPNQISERGVSSCLLFRMGVQCISVIPDGQWLRRQRKLLKLSWRRAKWQIFIRWWRKKHV